MNTPLSPAAPPLRIPARLADVGGIPIRRVLPTSARRTIGAWCFLDHAGPSLLDDGSRMRVGPHPHIGLQTFTWMMAGEVQHRDSLGCAQVIRPGQVNLMTAGTGITHTEESVGDGLFHSAQLWIALPESRRHGPAAFQHYPDLPRAEHGGLRLTLLVGRLLGMEAPTEVHSRLLGVDLACDGPAAARLPLRTDDEHGLLCLEGRLDVDGHAAAPGELLYLPPGRRQLDVRADGPMRALLIGGEPLGEDILIWWNFVARTQDEIVAAARDWAGGQRFGEVPGTTLARLTAPDVAGLRLKSPPATHRSPE